MDSLRIRLRSATAPLHERVDKLFSSFELEHADGYRRFLAVHALVLGPLERALEASGIETLLPDWPQRSRRQALLADLADLGIHTAAPQSPTETFSPGHCWGTAYVIEGSRLGGRVLARRVSEVQPDAPLRYLGRGSTTPSWAGFVEQLEKNAPCHPWTDILAGAETAFERFILAALSQRA